MGENSSIEWTHHTWNAWKGCRKISAGCKFCYMFTDMKRYGLDSTVVTRTKTWGDPPKWNRKAEASGIRERVFTCSWSDFFIPGADGWRGEAWEVICQCQSLDFLILTKRPERMRGRLPWGSEPWPNVWLGVSVENRRHGLPRIDRLRGAPAAVRFLSVEPLLEDLGELDLEGIHWVIIGGESGPGARPFNIDWAGEIIRQCNYHDVPCFVKQVGSQPTWGSSGRRLKGTTRKGGNPAEWPEWLRVREFPESLRA